MNFYERGFNLYLLLIAVTLTVTCGCQSEQTKQAKHLSALRIHVENRAQLIGSGETISVLRSNPVLVTAYTLLSLEQVYDSIPTK